MIEYQITYGASLLLAMNKAESHFDNNIIMMTLILTFEMAAPLLG